MFEKGKKNKRKQVFLIKLCNLKCRAHDKNDNFATGSIDLC